MSIVWPLAVVPLKPFLFSPYLRDLVEMVHVFTKMLEHFAKQQSHMIVKDKGKARKKSKGKATRMSGARQGDNSEEQQQLWLSVACSLSSALQGEEELPVDIVPYDSTLDNTEEEKKYEKNSLTFQDSERYLQYLL